MKCDGTRDDNNGRYLYGAAIYVELGCHFRHTSAKISPPHKMGLKTNIIKEYITWVHLLYEENLNYVFFHQYSTSNTFVLKKGCVKWVPGVGFSILNEVCRARSFCTEFIPIWIRLYLLMFPLCGHWSVRCFHSLCFLSLVSMVTHRYHHHPQYSARNTCSHQSCNDLLSSIIC